METIAAAFQKALSEIKAVTKDSKNPFLKNKYASLDAIIETCKPILAANGLAFYQQITTEGVNTVVLHTSGEKIESGYLKIDYEISKGLSHAQACGVSITYSKRYQLGSMLGISTEEDTDGQYADNSNLNKPAPMTTDKRPVLTDDEFNRALAAINKADANSQAAYEFAINKRQMSKVQRNTLDAAFDKIS